MDAFLKLAHERYSCRKIRRDRAVEHEKIEAIVEAALAAPTAVNLQAWRIWAIEDPDAMAKVVETSDFDYGGTAMLVLGVREDEAWVRKDDDWNLADLDGGIVGAHIVLAIQSLGLATTWIGKFHPDALVERFPQMAGCRLVGLFPLGYAADDAKPAPRHEQNRGSEIVEWL